MLAYNDILDVEKELETVTDDETRADMEELAVEFQREHYPNVPSKIKKHMNTYGDNEALVYLMQKLAAVSHAELGEHRHAKAIVEKLYKNNDAHSGRELVLLGELAFMSDYKLARRIMTEAVNNLHAGEEEADDLIMDAYLILGESEEKLDKLKRAVKYYKQGLAYHRTEDAKTEYMQLFMYFKIGLLSARLNELDEAISHLEQSARLSEETDPELKINSLVSIAQIYGGKGEQETAYTYAEEALELLPGTSLAGGIMHAEALKEKAYHLFQQEAYEEALPFYKKSLVIYENSDHYDPYKLGMLYMQYGYCLEHQTTKETTEAIKFLEAGAEQLEKTDDLELLHSVYTDIIDILEAAGKTQKQKIYERKLLELAEQGQGQQ